MVPRNFVPYSLLAIRDFYFIRTNTMNLEEMKVQFDAIRKDVLASL